MVKALADIKYSIIKSDRRTVCITVKPDLSIEVRAPGRMKPSDIEAFVLSKKDWLEKTLSKMEAAVPAEITYGSNINFFGEELTLTLSESKKTVLSDNLLLVCKGLSHKELKKAVVDFYKAEAKKYLPERVKEISITQYS